MGRILFASVATRIYRYFVYVSRIRGTVVAFGMAGGGLTVNRRSPEFQFCQQEGICYKFNVFECRNPNCFVYHICKRCWFFETIARFHASNDISRCDNMTPSYRASIEGTGKGDAPPGYYSQGDNKDNADLLNRSQSRGVETQSRGVETQSRGVETHSRRDETHSHRGETQSRRDETQSRREEPQSRREKTQSHREEPQSHREETQSRRDEYQSQSNQFQSRRGGNQSQSRGEEQVHNLSDIDESGHTEGGDAYRRISFLLQEERKLNQRLHQNNLDIWQQKENVENENKEIRSMFHDQKEKLEQENRELRLKLEEFQARENEWNSKSKARVHSVPVMKQFTTGDSSPASFSRIKLVTSYPSGYDESRRTRNTQNLETWGRIEVPQNPLNSKGDSSVTRGPEDHSIPVILGSSHGSGPSHRPGNGQPTEDITNLYKDSEDVQDNFDWQKCSTSKYIWE